MPSKEAEAPINALDADYFLLVSATLKIAGESSSNASAANERKNFGMRGARARFQFSKR